MNLMAKKQVTMTNLQLVAIGTAYLDRWLLHVYYTNPQYTSIGHDKEVAAFNKDRFHFTHSLVPRPHPDFISQPFSPWLRDKIWVGPGDSATSHTLHILQSGAFFVFLRTVGQLAFMCSTEPQALQPPPNQVREHHFSVFAKLHVKALVTFWVKSTRVVRT